ncbi:hypothetical protein PQR53_31290 [Paraburkholderia fungorum]|uniref:hypothetical protein n=1 Tax=Paraburkholderia fungorum TaxID=134537 RepID=UPI0038BA856A
MFDFVFCLRGACCLFFACGVGVCLILFAYAALLVCAFMVWAFPCFLIGLLASPLCGAGTYFSLPAAKKSRQKKAAQTANS